VIFQARIFSFREVTTKAGKLFRLVTVTDATPGDRLEQALEVACLDGSDVTQSDQDKVVEVHVRRLETSRMDGQVKARGVVKRIGPK